MKVKLAEARKAEHEIDSYNNRIDILRTSGPEGLQKEKEKAFALIKKRENALDEFVQKHTQGAYASYDVLDKRYKKLVEDNRSVVQFYIDPEEESTVEKISDIDSLAYSALNEEEIRIVDTPFFPFSLDDVVEIILRDEKENNQFIDRIKAIAEENDIRIDYLVDHDI